MEQMPVQLDVAQTTASSQSTARPGVKNESGKDGEFGQMISQIQKRFGSKDEERIAAVVGNAFGTQTIDLLTLQQLTAMQMLNVDPRQIVVMQEANPEQQVATPLIQLENAPVEAATAEIPQQTQVEMQKDPMMQQGTAEQQIVEEIPEIKTAAPTEDGMNMQQKSEQPEMPAMPQEKKTAEQSEMDGLDVSTDGVQQKVFNQVETAPVKVSETASEPAMAKSVEHQVDTALTKALANGETKVELQLAPKHLGKITIELTQRQDGTLEVVLHAENNHTRMLLEREAPNMQNTFGRSTQQEVLVEVPRHQEAQQNNSYDGHQQQRQQQQERQQEQKRSEDFLNQMRLGFAPVEDATI